MALAMSLILAGSRNEYKMITQLMIDSLEVTVVIKLRNNKISDGRRETYGGRETGYTGAILMMTNERRDVSNTNFS